MHQPAQPITQYECRQRLYEAFISRAVELLGEIKRQAAAGTPGQPGQTAQE